MLQLRSSDEIDDILITVERHDPANQVRPDVDTALRLAAPGLSGCAHYHTNRQRAVAGEGEVPGEQLSRSRLGRVER